MNKIYLLLILISVSLSAQIKGVVKDSLTGNPIPYVNIWVENKNIGTTSEENGSFSIDLKNDSVLFFSALGYETKRLFSIKEIVFLKPKIFELNEVIIENPKFKEEIEVGNYETSGFRIGIGNINSAVFFKPDSIMLAHPFVKEIKFLTKSDIENAKIRIKILSVNTDYSPGESLLDDEIIIMVKKGKHKNIANISNYKIKIPSEGFFISFEKLLIEENKYFFEYNYKDKNGKKVNHKSMSIEPELCFVPEEKDIVWQSSITGSWKKTSKQILDKPKSYENLLMRKYHNKYLIPSMLITLTN
ncbi:carboxypeptidase-like regulatory domain-containing protein [Flavobacterium chungnamense]|uniref:Carboxypeptidase-like regulatory domain-containing protein n=1 Tax=Flavobacterium chungnamense TaxID=706182 RepID=A0ABP7USS2_9FLAO